MNLWTLSEAPMTPLGWYGLKKFGCFDPCPTKVWTIGHKEFEHKNQFNKKF